MEQRTLGKTGLRVSVLGFGGAEIGYENASPEAVDRLLGSALDAGLNVIDTAECYVDSEEKIGRAVASRRGDFHLFTKCGHAAGLGVRDWDIDLLASSIDRSLQRLRTDHVDLVQLHSPSEAQLRQGDIIAVLQRAKAAGKTRFIGCSADGGAARYAVECGAFDTLQTSVNIADQEALEISLPLARERGIGVIAKRPVANAAWKTGKKPASPYHHVYYDRLQKLAYEFLGGDVNAAVGFALRWTLSTPGVDVAIVGTQNPDRWHQNAEQAAAGPLPPEEYEAIRARFREVAGPDWVGQG